MSSENVEVEYVGRYFEDSQEAIDFLMSKNLLTQELLDSWQEDLEDGERVTNLLMPSDIAIDDFPELLDVDIVTGDDGMFLGYILETNVKRTSKTKFNKDVKDAKEKWKKIFKEDAELKYVVRHI